jgi:hypothetical protein
MINNPLKVWLNYIVIAALIALGAGWLYNYVARQQLALQVSEQKTELQGVHAELKTTREDLDAAVIVNEAQGRAINEVERLRTIDATILSGLVKDLDASRNRNRVTLDRLQVLEKTNEQVRQYLNQPVPSSVSCLLDNSCSPNGDENGNRGEAPKPGAPGRVPGPAAGAKSNNR